MCRKFRKDTPISMFRVHQIMTLDRTNVAHELLQTMCFHLEYNSHKAWTVFFFISMLCGTILSWFLSHFESDEGETKSRNFILGPDFYILGSM